MHSHSDREAWTWPALILAVSMFIAVGGARPVEAVNRLSEPPIGELAQATAEAKGPSILGRYLAGRAARRDGDSTSAADFLAFALAGDPKNEQLQAEAFAVLIADGRMALALALASEIQKREPRTALGNIVLAVAAAKRSDFKTAQSHASKASRRRLYRLIVPLVEAWTKAGLSQFDDATKSLAALAKRKAFVDFQRYHDALIDDLAGNSDKAETAYRSLVEGDEGGNLRWYQAYGNFLERSGRAEDAKKIYQRARERDPDDVVLTRLVENAGQGGPPQRFVADAGTGLAEALFGVATVLSQEGALEAAMTYARLAVYLRPDYPVAQVLIGRILEAHQHWEKAIAAYERIAPKSDYAWDSQLRTASSLQRLERYDEAIALLGRMAERQPKRTESLVALGDLYRSRERWREAVLEYDRAVKRVPDLATANWTLLYARGIALERAKDWKRAEVDFLRALELRPDQPLVLNYLGYSWIEQGQNLDRARKMIEKAVSLRPRDGYIVDSLGWVMFRLGEFPGAVKQLERAVELRPQDPVINDHLGDAYWRVGREVEARFQWQRALAFKPQEKFIPEIKGKLDEGLRP